MKVVNLLLWMSSWLMATSVFAAPENRLSSKTLKERALAEAKVEGLSKKSASDAQVSGMLKLKDPRPEVVTRSWDYFMAFSGQKFQAQGVAQKDGIGTFDLSKNSPALMPGFEVGVLSHSLQTQMLSWKLGLRAKAAVSSQETQLNLESGYKINDARLNATLLSMGPHIHLQWERLEWISFTFSPQFGSLNYTQTSSNDFAAFSKRANFQSMGYGLDFNFGNKWSIFTEWNRRSLKENQEIALQNDSFELGTRITW